MIKKYSIIILVFLYSCSPTWQESIKRGSVDIATFNSETNFDLIYDLVIVPVTIGGKEYNFLFDTGAPLSISNEIQNELNFKRLSSGSIIDSDSNRKKVDYVEIPKIQIASIPFVEQTAFVADFKANSLLECLNIDGIIGSNLIRKCNWILDFEQLKITLINHGAELSNFDEIIEYRNDNQYNIYMDCEIGNHKIKNIQVDLGFNGYVSLKDDLFKKLENSKSIDFYFVEEGEKNSGIVGKNVSFNRKISIVDSLKFKDVTLNNSKVKSSKSSALGTQVFSNFIMMLDTKNKNVLLARNNIDEKIIRSYGFSFLEDKTGKLKVSSVVRDFEADKQGIELGDEIISIDSLDYKNENLCNFYSYVKTIKDSLSIKYVKKDGGIKISTLYAQQIADY